MATQTITYRLPIPGWPRAVFETDFGYNRGRLAVEARTLIDEPRGKLVHGAEAELDGRWVSLRLVEREGDPEVMVAVDGRPAVREDALRTKPSPSAWKHAFGALFASFAGFVASYLYLLKAEATGDAWSMKMAIHTAGWHLLLTLLLFPASVWGQRQGIRAVQFVSLVFFLIHLGMALANLPGEEATFSGPWIATFNALSGAFFLWATIYGQVAARDMDPLKELLQREA